MRIDRLPAIPLIASDPYISFWMPSDRMGVADSIHWFGTPKPIRGVMTVDGKKGSYLGRNRAYDVELTHLNVTPTATHFTSVFEGVELKTSFITPALPDDPDLMSMPVTLVCFSIASVDGKAHDVEVTLHLSESLCYQGETAPKMLTDQYMDGELNVAFCGQMVQKPLCHSGDRVTIDWGYLYLASHTPLRFFQGGPQLVWQGQVTGEKQDVRAIIAYDDIASINYFGDLCKPWYRRNGAQITDAIRLMDTKFDEVLARCEAMDAKVLDEAGRISEDYQQIVCAAWRQTLCAHKLIATPKGDMVLLSKENDSNGCLGTADVSYPSIPLFLKYNPELVNALCRPILEFASMPVWTDDFAPHDVGRYPYATGQVYAARRKGVINGDTHPPYYLYPAGSDVYDLKYQMPVEECGNMLIMLAAAQQYGADKLLAHSYRPLLDQWVQYLIRYGEDPGEQLCTDDFGGHLAHNVNLAAKAIVGVACYGRLTGEKVWEEKAREMASRFAEKIGMNGDTPLTLTGLGWSIKYNLLWDRVMNLGLLPDSFYDAETRSYLPRINRYGLPLDSRADYTKSDWICWAAALAEDPQVRAELLKPVARMLRESESRVPFPDWYDTKNGRFVSFIARSVQGGVFAPLLC